MLKRVLFLSGMVSFTVILIFSCNPGGLDPLDEADLQWKADTAAIGSFIRKNKLKAITDPNGISVVIKKIGTGLPPIKTSQVEVAYTGKLLSGEIFDSNNINGDLKDFVQGFSAALQLLPEGTSAIVFIPSVLAYGRNGNAVIPPNSPILFDLVLNKVVKDAEYLTQLYRDTTAVYEYLKAKNITSTTKHPSGMRYEIVQPGSGASPGWYDKVRIAYSASLMTTGEVVTTGTSEPNEIFYSWVVNYLPAFQVALQRMAPGSKAMLYVPSGLAFGTVSVTTGRGVIPPNSNLVYELELLEVLR